MPALAFVIQRVWGVINSHSWVFTSLFSRYLLKGLCSNYGFLVAVGNPGEGQRSCHQFLPRFVHLDVLLVVGAESAPTSPSNRGSSAGQLSAPPCVQFFPGLLDVG